ncbi:hypothetical protein [Nitrosomonas sp. Nm34]|uniref:hypothetical protein n=1 Tax=Nitrosomonas sp. Nm34 TaxID=1881055 RepID=UPI0008E5ECF8|nr:hypothetical protein [Nitrosomonas sp. Nm34]SFI70853.1 hypothetical protein SAMN05428978_102831 [Nitrosomonas sp. Nm34]
MGGFRSGQWRRGRNTTKDYLALDVRKLQRDGYLTSDRILTIRWFCNHRKIGTINITTQSDHIVMKYHYQHENDDRLPMEYIVKLERTLCNYGEQRPWFICPVTGCGRRVAILYGGKVFSCRYCHKLAYASQREDVHDRALRRADKIRERLGWEPGILNEMGEKPKGMHWHTFDRLIDAHNIIFEANLRKLAKQFGIKLKTGHPQC